MSLYVSKTRLPQSALNGGCNTHPRFNDYMNIQRGWVYWSHNRWELAIFRRWASESGGVLSLTTSLTVDTSQCYSPPAFVTLCAGCVTSKRGASSLLSKDKWVMVAQSKLVMGKEECSTKVKGKKWGRTAEWTIPKTETEKYIQHRTSLERSSHENGKKGSPKIRPFYCRIIVNIVQ